MSYRCWKRLPGLVAVSAVLAACQAPPSAGPAAGVGAAPGPAAVAPAPVRRGAYRIAAVTAPQLRTMNIDVYGVDGVGFLDWWDLDADVVYPVGGPTPNQPAAADILFNYDTDTNPDLAELQVVPNVLGETTGAVCRVAHTAEAFDTVTWGDILALGSAAFGAQFVILTGTAIVRTRLNRHYKITVEALDPDPLGPTAVIKWQELRSPLDTALEIVQEVLVMGDGVALSTAQAESLATKLRAAIGKLEQERENTAANQIGAFVNEVDGMERGGLLTAVQAGGLRNAANLLLLDLAE